MACITYNQQEIILIVHGSNEDDLAVSRCHHAIACDQSTFMTE